MNITRVIALTFLKAEIPLDILVWETGPADTNNRGDWWATQDESMEWTRYLPFHNPFKCHSRSEEQDWSLITWTMLGTPLEVLIGRPEYCSGIGLSVSIRYTLYDSEEQNEETYYTSERTCVVELSNPFTYYDTRA